MKTFNQRFCFLKCPVDLIFNLESDFRQQRFMGLAVENTVGYHRKLQAMVKDNEGAGKRCSECGVTAGPSGNP